MLTMQISILCCLFLGALVLHGNYGLDDKELYIVYMGERPNGQVSAALMHNSLLEKMLGSAGAKDSLVYSYGRSFNGFAARLSDEEAARIERLEGVVSVFPNKVLQVHTTRSWDFMGFPQGFKTARYPLERDVIVGLLDTGIWPESASFSDKDMGPPPSKWKGTCPSNFTCNKKIIGARFYNSLNFSDPWDFQSPRDSEGHGTHTSSTAAGVEVPDTSFYGLASGTVRGAVPHARIAMYKVCWSLGCATADILAAMDDAIADGVDVLSISLGGGPEPYFEDVLAIGSFHAMKNGILTSLSAGNSGPVPQSVINGAPWALTVAASTIDRKFIAKVVLGNGQTFIGNSINSFTLLGSEYPLIYGGAAPNVSAGAFDETSSLCSEGSLNSYKVKNKIVLCDTIWDGSGVLVANGLGTIMSYAAFTDFAFSYPLPATLISVEDGANILKYIQSTSNPIATILTGETMEHIMAPTVVSFSSRGPNSVTLDILKPDLTAPGVDILAAWSPVAGPSIYWKDTRRVKYNVISGTSMSCPHVGGAAAYIKSAHPDWSPAAIKSALMTTASVMDPKKHRDAEFSYGSGQIDPKKALNPGLVFDASERDYVNFLCGQGYNTTTLSLVTGDSSQCPNNPINGKAWSLNYPSFALAVEDGQQAWGTFDRTVTNVGTPNSTYYATVYAPSYLTVTVSPTVLFFGSVGEMKSFNVEVKGGVIAQQPIISGYILWKDATHVVRTPLVVFTVLPSAKPMYSGMRSNRMSGFSEGYSMYHKNGIFHKK